MKETPPAALEAASAATGFELRIEARLRGRFGWRAASPEAVAYVASDEEGRRRLLREGRIYSWAREQNIPVPRTLAAATDGSYLVMQRVPVDSTHGTSYVQRSLDVAERISKAAPPASQVVSGARVRKPRWRSIPLRWARLASSDLSTPEVVGVSRRAALLRSDVLTHGDFDTRNVLFDADSETIHVVDWEFLGYAPRLTDVAMLWTTLERHEDRRLLEKLLAERLDGPQQAELALLMRWMSLRLLVEVLTWSPVRGRDLPRIERGFTVLEEAREHDRSRKIDGHG